MLKIEKRDQTKQCIKEKPENKQAKHEEQSKNFQKVHAVSGNSQFIMIGHSTVTITVKQMNIKHWDMLNAAEWIVHND